MKNQPQNGVGLNFFERLGGVSQVNSIPHKKQDIHDRDSSIRCKCDGDGDSPSNRSINFVAGTEDAVDLRPDISAADLSRRYHNRMRYGYCNACAMEYLRGYFTKLHLIKERR